MARRVARVLALYATAWPFTRHMTGCLVERVLVLLAAVSAAARAEGIEFVNEEHTRRALRRLLEKCPHALRATADEDLHST